MSYKKVIFPNPLAHKSEKDKESYGVAVAEAIRNSTKEYRDARNKRIAECRLFAKGEQPIKPYLDVMTDDGKTSYNNIIYRNRNISSKYEEIVVNGYMEQLEYPKVTAMSKHIQDRKNRRKDEARFRMDYGDIISQISQEAGLPVEDPSAFTPKNKEELDIWFDLNDREIEEILMQRMLTFTAEDVKINEIKLKILKEQFQAGVHGVYDYLDNNGRFRVEFIKGEDCIYDYFPGEQSENLNFAGRYLRMSISEIRARWKMTPEKERHLCKIANAYSSKFGNTGHFYEWNSSYVSAEKRPYDSTVVEIMHIWHKTSKVVKYLEGKDRYGRDIFKILNEGEEIKDSPNKNIGYTLPLTAYEGYFIAHDGCLCLEWGEARNILREGEDKETILCPFEFRIPGNTGEDMLPVSPLYKIIPDLMEMDILELKIKTAIARSAPSGMAVDIDSLVEIDLGEGVGIADPVTIGDIYRNTGFLYYRSKNDDGTINNSPPIQIQQSGFDPQIRGFLDLYNWRRNEIRETLGINEFRDGSATSPRIGFRYAQSQLSQSNTATLALYRAWLTTGQVIYNHAGIRIWDSLVFGNPNKGYLKFLGKKDSDFIKNAKDITASSYDIKFEMGMTMADQETLEANIQTCLASGTLDISDAITIREIDDVRLAQRYLAWRMEVRRQEREESAQRQSEMSARANAQAGVQVEQARAQTEQIILQSKTSMIKTQTEAERDKEMEKLVWDLIRKQQEGIPIPQEYLGIVDMVLQNRGINQNTETNQKVSEQQAIQQEQMMQQQQMMSEEGQEMGGMMV